MTQPITVVTTRSPLVGSPSPSSLPSLSPLPPGVVVAGPGGQQPSPVQPIILRSVASPRRPSAILLPASPPVQDRWTQPVVLALPRAAQQPPASRAVPAVLLATSPITSGYWPQPLVLRLPSPAVVPPIVYQYSVRYESGLSTYAQLLNPVDGTAWNGSCFVDPLGSAWPTCAAPMHDDGAGTYSGRIPDEVPPGTYLVQAYLQIASDPAICDPIIGAGFVYRPGLG